MQNDVPYVQIRFDLCQRVASLTLDFNRVFAIKAYRPLSRRLDRCDRVIHNESGDPNGGNMRSFSGATCTSRDVTMQITFLTRKSALIYRRDLRQRVASLTLNGIPALDVELKISGNYGTRQKMRTR